MKSAILIAILVASSLAGARPFSKVVCAVGPNLVLASTNLNKTVNAEVDRQTAGGEVSCWVSSKSLGGLSSHVVRSIDGITETVEACTTLNLDIGCG